MIESFDDVDNLTSRDLKRDTLKTKLKTRDVEKAAITFRLFAYG